MNTKYNLMRQNSKPNTMHSVKHGVINKSLYVQSIILGKTFAVVQCSIDPVYW